MSFGERLCGLRKKQGITQEMLAHKLNLVKSSVSSYERGKLPPLITAQKIANYFGVSLDYLLGDTDYPYIISPEKDFSKISDNDRLALIKDFIALVEKYDIKNLSTKRGVILSEVNNKS